MRYVAFIDTLGFTKRITQCTHQEAVEIIRMFNQTIFDLWKEFNLDNDFSIRGRTFSDSVIIHTKGDSIEELDRILKFIIKHINYRAIGIFYVIIAYRLYKFY